MHRRDFLIRSGQAVALAAVTGGTGLLFHNREVRGYTPILAAQPRFHVDSDSTLPAVTLARNDDPLVALHKSLDAIGGIKRFIATGDRVTLKPNIGWDRLPEQAANTNPLLVGEMARLCLAAGAAEVVVTDMSCNEPRRCFLRSGIRDAAEKAGARVILPADEDFVQVNLDGQVLTVWPVLKHFIMTDKLINMPIVKQHSMSQCTIAMKNLYGILGGPRFRLHQQIDQSIVDLVRFCTPTLTVVDATRVLLRNGPTGGSLDDVAAENSVLCATDQVAVDARGAEFLGLQAHRVGHIRLAEKSGLGTMDYRAAGYKEIV